MGPSSDDCGGGTGDARFERLGMRCGVTFAEPSDSGCVASSSLTARSRLPLCPKKGSCGFTPRMGDEYTLRRVRLFACHTTGTGQTSSLFVVFNYFVSPRRERNPSKSLWVDMIAGRANAAQLNLQSA